MSVYALRTTYKLLTWICESQILYKDTSTYFIEHHLILWHHDDIWCYSLKNHHWLNCHEAQGIHKLLENVWPTGVLIFYLFFFTILWFSFKVFKIFHADNIFTHHHEMSYNVHQLFNKEIRLGIKIIFSRVIIFLWKIYKSQEIICG